MENISEKATFAPLAGRIGYRVDGKWYPVDKESLKSPKLKKDIQRYAELRGSEQLKKDYETVQKVKAARQRLLNRPPSEATGVVDPKWDKPSSQAPTPQRSRGGSGQTPAAPSRPSRTPATTTQRPSAPRTPAPKPVAQTGDKAKDMAVWSQRFPKLAAKVTSTGTQRGTGQSVMSKQADELRGMQKASPEPQAAQSGPMYSSPDVKSKMSTRSKRLLGVSEQYDAYDIVLDYLFSEGHVESLEEALYVMMEMDSETIQSIVEAGPLLPGESGKAPSSGYKEPILPGEKREVKYMKKPAPGQTQKLPPA